VADDEATSGEAPEGPPGEQPSALAVDAGEPTEGEHVEAPASEAPEPAALPAGPDPLRELRRTRLLLPVLLPLGAAVAIAVFVLNVSRIFLAAGSTGAIVLGVALIVLILGGAAAISAAPRLRTSTIVMMVSAALLVVISAGLVAAPASVETKGGPSGYVPPKGPPVATLEVDALGTLNFQSKAFTVQSGVVQINYVSKDGNHTLAFDPPGPPTFLLSVPPNGTVTNKVLLKAGTTYTIFCTIPGHRAAGMVATLTAQ
jgi:plastocyanin